MQYIFNSFCSLLTVREQLPGTAGDSFSWGFAMLEYGGNVQCCKEALNNTRKVSYQNMILTHTEKTRFV